MNPPKSPTSPTIKTRFLILSDTHSREFGPETNPTQHADVVIHCGDLTEGSTLEELHSAIHLLSNLTAPLKLVIAGNHDFTLDTPFFKDKVAGQFKVLDPGLIKKAYGDPGEARQLFNEEPATSAGIVFLDEGTHHFTLENGASLTLYASPFIPACGGWAFQYTRQKGHDFRIEKGVDLVITHSPPRGILDRTLSGDQVGSTHLFDAVARSRPRLHCFGHIHEGWGAKLVTWPPRAENMGETPLQLSDIDDGQSVVVGDLSTVRSREANGAGTGTGTGTGTGEHSETCYVTSHCSGDANPVELGRQTLFVNASIKEMDEDFPQHLPWLVDIELPKEYDATSDRAACSLWPTMSSNHSSSGHQAGSPPRRSLTPHISTLSAASRLNGSMDTSSPLSSPLSLCSPSGPPSSFISPVPLERTTQCNVTSSPSPVPHFTSEGVFSNTTMGSRLPEASSGQQQTISSSNSFSQRIVRDGQVIITNSDEDTDSLSDLETADDLFNKFLKPIPGAAHSTSFPTKAHNGRDDDNGSSAARRSRQPYAGLSSLKSNDSINLPKYQFSLDTLVEDAANDKRTEAKVAKIKKSLQPKAPSDKSCGVLRDDLLAAAVENETDTKGIQRLRDAVERTEMFAIGRSWLFFEEDPPAVPQPKFPSKSIAPGSWQVNLKDLSSRGRAFFSGIVADSLSINTLPDEILLWILQAVTTEQDDYLRMSYSNVLINSTSRRISSLINPSCIDQIFQRLGARPAALALSSSLEPDYTISDEYRIRDHKYLLSALQIIHALSEKFDDNTREYVLKVILRLAIDEGVMTDCLISLEVQKIITSLLGAPDKISDLTLYDISLHLFKTVKHPELQIQLLKNILPMNPRIALFRCRLAWAYFYQDSSPLGKPQEHLFDLPRLTAYLRHDKRFDSNAPRNNPKTPFNFWELHALTCILDIAIDSGTTKPSFSGSRESEFNAVVDGLADVIKAIFSAIRDSGASHLRRSEARENLQALYYRLAFGVRTRPRPAKALFVIGERAVEKHQKTLTEHVKVVGDGGSGRVEGKGAR
ncbi:uncharacterized protein PADG_12385 [Paracoccidioides brasiliensis Pb18]|uniref:Calcineurin-like phosphoesterase domain-containing protein n=1 Tax=Paracoccidioides brasiliensis (strain Pb18) TaxID=502780 RepID=A0A0A0HS93_PARBD|nr:uncharacterized protein PADG_12385 [Paracoccidioides brasiliensis Pb18]KGM91527.1 hypothetical protein PADG_12385 [Paracoccidioides brasiliensis Pb18]